MNPFRAEMERSERLTRMNLRKAIVLRALLSAAVSVAILASAVLPALAHGGATLTVTPSQAEAGGQITVEADGVEPGEIFTIRLEGLSDPVVLGEVSVAEGEDGFSAVFDLPADVLPGPYQVTATSEEGESLTAELSVVSAAVAPEAVEVREPSAEPMELDRSRPALQAGLIVAALLASAALGVVLIRRKA